VPKQKQSVSVKQSKLDKNVKKLSKSARLRQNVNAVKKQTLHVVLLKLRPPLLNKHNNKPVYNSLFNKLPYVSSNVYKAAGFALLGGLIIYLV